jgi:hypothetical protein
MKWLLLSCLVFLIALQILSVKKTKAINLAKKTAMITDTINFTKQVQPIFIKNCSPCHFPGGKMYLRMPFDQDTTIIIHQAGILRRIKKPEENLILKSFIEQNKNSLPDDKPLH